MNGKIRACIVAEAPLSRLPPVFYEKPQTAGYCTFFCKFYIKPERQYFTKFSNTEMEDYDAKWSVFDEP